MFHTHVLLWCLFCFHWDLNWWIKSRGQSPSGKALPQSSLYSCIAQNHVQRAVCDLWVLYIWALAGSAVSHWMSNTGDCCFSMETFCVFAEIIRHVWWLLCPIVGCFQTLNWIALPWQSEFSAKISSAAVILPGFCFFGFFLVGWFCFLGFFLMQMDWKALVLPFILLLEFKPLDAGYPFFSVHADVAKAAPDLLLLVR